MLKSLVHTENPFCSTQKIHHWILRRNQEVQVSVEEIAFAEMEGWNMAYMGQEGELFKAFDIKDGYAIKEMLPTMGIIPVVITARESQIVAHRYQELGVIELHQGCRDKIGKLKEILKLYGQKDGMVYGLSSVAYVGDDLLDVIAKIEDL